MGELLAFDQTQLFFGDSLPHNVRVLMQDAIEHYDHTGRAEASIREALNEVPDNLEILIALYKFYFYKKRLADAEAVVHIALQAAAKQGGFPPEWHCLQQVHGNWSLADSPQRAYLFTLKALAFIRLRSSDKESCLRILDKIAELDKDDLVGSSVIRALAEEADDGD